MKAAAILLISTFCLSNAKIMEFNDDPRQAKSICDNPESDEVLVPHEHCNQFYKCIEGKLAVLNCPGDLLYNPHKEYCDYPKQVECGDRIISRGNSVGSRILSKENSVCANAETQFSFVPHEHCAKFYFCLNGAAVELSCARNLLYNTQKRTCDWHKNVECEGRII